ncbi:hypothetical protein V7014_25210, partial [Bacillus sp. JJ722]
MVELHIELHQRIQIANDTTSFIKIDGCFTLFFLLKIGECTLWETGINVANHLTANIFKILLGIWNIV